MFGCAAPSSIEVYLEQWAARAECGLIAALPCESGRGPQPGFLDRVLSKQISSKLDSEGNVCNVGSTRYGWDSLLFRIWKTNRGSLGSVLKQMGDSLLKLTNVICRSRSVLIEWWASRCRIILF